MQPHFVSMLSRRVFCLLEIYIYICLNPSAQEGRKEDLHQRICFILCGCLVYYPFHTLFSTVKFSGNEIAVSLAQQQRPTPMVLANIMFMYYNRCVCASWCSYCIRFLGKMNCNVPAWCSFVVKLSDLYIIEVSQCVFFCHNGLSIWGI